MTTQQRPRPVRSVLSESLIDELMAIELSIKAAVIETVWARKHRAATTDDGYLYVVQFAAGAVKVGKTTNPTMRLASHAKHAKVHGDCISRSWVSAKHAGHSAAEGKLIGFCKGAGDCVAGEYFARLSFDQVCEFARMVLLDHQRRAELDRLTIAAGGDLSMTWAEAHRRAEIS